MFYITGDTHGEFGFLDDFCVDYNTSVKDYLIILGDSGINYYSDGNDKYIKEKISNHPITLLCVQGNHEERAENISTYKKRRKFKSDIFVEPEYPNILFLQSGNVYEFNKKSVLVLGGAYSVDKELRLTIGANWFESEQLSPIERSNILKDIRRKHFNYVLSHTCPYTYQPISSFKYELDNVDTTMEQFLDSVMLNIQYDQWYCGHFHIDKDINNFHFMMNRIEVLDV